MSADDFDWMPERECIVVHPQSAIAVYENPYGAVVIRQQGDMYDEDAWVVIERAHAGAVIDAIRTILESQEAEAPPAKSSGADRQRRYRERKRRDRHAVTIARVVASKKSSRPHAVTHDASVTPAPLLALEHHPEAEHA